VRDNILSGFHYFDQDVVDIPGMRIVTAIDEGQTGCFASVSAKIQRANLTPGVGYAVVNFQQFYKLAVVGITTAGGERDAL
jgi:hypothetical protein